MQILKRVLGVGLILLAILFLFVGLGAGGSEGPTQSIVDSPEESGKLIGTLIPVVLFGASGLWCLFSNARVK
jgi:ABC-type Na+ efflux pump permease subunit